MKVIGDVPDDRFRELIAEFALDTITDEQAYQTGL
jgi:hypothetical protein